jgi:hypothetical protein
MRTILYLALMLWRRSQGPPPKQRRPKSIEQRRNERELFFWTVREVLALARQTLRLLLLAALVIYVIASLIEGRPAALIEIILRPR